VCCWGKNEIDMENSAKKFIAHKFKFGLTKLFRQDVNIAFAAINLFVQIGKGKEEIFPLSCITSSNFKFSLRNLKSSFSSPF